MHTMFQCVLRRMHCQLTKLLNHTAILNYVTLFWFFYFLNRTNLLKCKYFVFPGISLTGRHVCLFFHTQNEIKTKIFNNHTYCKIFSWHLFLTRELCLHLTSKWTEEGCKVNQSDHERTVCQCNHLTNFAILMRPYSPVRFFVL